MARYGRFDYDPARGDRFPQRVYGGRGLDELYGGPSGGFRRPVGWDRQGPPPVPRRGWQGGRGELREGFQGRYPHPFHGGMDEYYSGTHHGHGPIGQSSWEHGYTTAPGHRRSRGTAGNFREGYRGR